MRLRLDSALKTIKTLSNDKMFKGTPIQKAVTKLMASVEKSKLEVVKAEKLYEKEGQADWAGRSRHQLQR